ncbi:MAG: YicC/YloC family endoribonuclease [bacterium]
MRRKMRSMTGYGRGEGMWEGEHFQVEVRSLNHRYLECSIKIPKQYSYLQEKIRSTVQRYVTRGRVEVNVSALDEKSEAKEVRVDKDLALAYYNALKELSNYLQLDLEVDIKAIADFPDVFLVEEKEPDQENSQRALEIALTAALEDLVAMRAAEGEKLQEDIIHRIAIIEQVIKDIEERAPQVVVEYRNGLKQRMEKFLAGEIEEGRLLTEVAYFAEKANINEELVRMFSHIDLFRSTLKEEGAIGRKLDFILQEMYREINTIGSKAGDTAIARAVVEVKSELEKIREQVQNIE